MGEKESATRQPVHLSNCDEQFERNTCTIGIRHLQVVLHFFCIAVNYLMRINLSVGIVLMTDSSSNSTAPVYDWTMAQRSGALSAFSGGYFFMNLAGAMIFSNWDHKRLLLASVGVSSVLTVSTPALIAACGYYMLLAIRVVLGLLQGILMVSIMSLLSRWIPPTERGRCGSLVLCGAHFGTIVSMALSGWLGTVLGGWPAVFYFPGAVGLVWTLAWAAVGADAPSSSRFVSLQEKTFIESSLRQDKNMQNNGTIPWKKMLRNRACWALVIVSLADAWGFSTLITEMPTYFESILNLNNTENGLVSATPYACLLFAQVPFSYLADVLVKKKITSVAFSRKFCNTIGHCGPAAALIVLTYTKSSRIVVAMYTTCITLYGFIFIGFNINHLDIVPEHSGFLMGITNGVANITAFLAPIFAGFVVSEPDNHNQWAIVFWVASAIFIIGNIIFVVFGSGKVQEFTDDKSPRRNASSEEEP